MFDYTCDVCQCQFFIEEGYDANKDVIICPECGQYVKERK